MSDDNIVEFTTGASVIGDGLAIEPDQILDSARDTFIQVVVIGFDKDGEFQVRSSHGSREALWMIARAQHHVLIETRDD